MKFLNFNTLEDKASITQDQLIQLMNEEDNAKIKNDEVYVSMVHHNFEEKGNLMMVISPIDFYDNKMDRHYKYQANFLGADENLNGRICGVYSSIDIAKFHVDSFYGAKTLSEFEKRENAIAPRIEAIEKTKKERTL